METIKFKREWVKTAAIIFLSILLGLTFFSNTIMNRSLPEVAAQSTESGSIHAKIRGSGTVTANEVYEVTLAQTRKVESVPVRVGDQVAEGDVLLRLEGMESEELKQAREALKELELGYQQKLLEHGNADSAMQRQIRKLTERYDEALRDYHLYTAENPADIAKILRDSQQQLRKLEQDAANLEAELAATEQWLTEAKADEEIRLARLKELETQMENAQLQIESLTVAMEVLDKDKNLYLESYLRMEQTAMLTRGQLTLREKMEYYVNNPGALQEDAAIALSQAEECIRAYQILTADLEAVLKNLEPKPDSGESPEAAPAGLDPDENATFEVTYSTVSAAQTAQMTAIRQNLTLAEQTHQQIAKQSEEITNREAELKSLRQRSRETAAAVSSQREVVAVNQSAAEAAREVRAAEDSLQDKLFEAGLADPESLTLAAERAKIREQQALIQELSEDADGAEIVARVCGTVSEIHATPGEAAPADTAIVSITVADRGYLVQVPVTAEQARNVHVGDAAEVTNFYWGGVTATLENITADPDSKNGGRLLLFRVSGEGLEPGTSLNLSIGQKSASYDCLVPNSAIRSDSNGTFVLVVVSRSSPLGNRYVAVRADVQVLAADDTKSAVSGLNSGDYVITTSTRPLEAGMQVRLVDNA